MVRMGPYDEETQTWKGRLGTHAAQAANAIRQWRVLETHTQET
jgi:hypothetical protein